MHNEYKDVGPTSRQAVQELDPVYDKKYNQNILQYIQDKENITYYNTREGKWQ